MVKPLHYIPPPFPSNGRGPRFLVKLNTLSMLKGVGINREPLWNVVEQRPGANKLKIKK